MLKIHCDQVNLATMPIIHMLFEESILPISLKRSVGVRLMIVALLGMLSALSPAVHSVVKAQEVGVINTNYPMPGATDAAPIRTTSANYNDYSNMDTDPVSITAAERDALLARLKNELAPGTQVITINQWTDAQLGIDAIQIVNNVPIQGVLFTIFLPPHWQRTMKIPVVLSGDGLGNSNNERLWKNGDTGLLGLTALAAISGFHPIIAAITNSGGTESMGIDEHTYRAIGGFFDFIGQNGGDAQRVVIEGASRGGLNALMWSINPLKLNYNVIATFADIMPTAMGTLSQRSVLTYPNMSYLFSTAAHNSDIYQYGLSNGPGHYDLKTLIGTSDPVEADARSPIGMAERLKGKVLVIGRGTHDPFVPFRDFVAFDHRLNDLGITHTSINTLGQGHNGSPVVLQYFAFYVRGLMDNKPEIPPAGRYFYINLLPPNGISVALSEFIKNGAKADPKVPPAKNMAMPFTAEVPPGAGVGLPVDISLCGTPGMTYGYIAQTANGSVWTKGDGRFDKQECAYTTIAAPDTPGNYLWTFTYNSKPVPSNYTPIHDENGCSALAKTSVAMVQPSPDDLNAGVFDLGYGVDQYSAQKDTCKPT